MDDQRLTLLYTANVLGQLDRLPRLFSLIQQVRTAADTLTLLVDLGNSCHADAAICAATEGRAALLVFDAMGYDGACLTQAECQQMTGEALAKLRNTVQMALCGLALAGDLPSLVSWQVGGCTVLLNAAGPSESTTIPRSGPVVTICPRLDSVDNQWDAATQTLYLVAPPAGLVGRVDFTVALSDQRSSDRRLSDRQLAVTFSTIPLRTEHQLAVIIASDATIAAAVDFVQEEAHLYQRQVTRQRVHHKGGTS
ncbi:hypothetical protein ACFLYO_04110 [Chloroflexota bacterium]